MDHLPGHGEITEGSILRTVLLFQLFGQLTWGKMSYNTRTSIATQSEQSSDIASYSPNCSLASATLGFRRKRLW